MIMEIFLEVGGFNMDSGAELSVVNLDIDIQECNTVTWEKQVFHLKWKE